MSWAREHVYFKKTQSSPVTYSILPDYRPTPQPASTYCSNEFKSRATSLYLEMNSRGGRGQSCFTRNGSLIYLGVSLCRENRQKQLVFLAETAQWLVLEIRLG